MTELGHIYFISADNKKRASVKVRHLSHLPHIIVLFKKSSLNERKVQYILSNVNKHYHHTT